MTKKKTGTTNSTRSRWNKFAGCSFLITFLVEFEIYYERGRLNRTPSIILKMQLRYSQ